MVGGELVAGRIAQIEYDGVRFQLYQASISIADGSIGTAKLADGAVTTIKIDDLNVTMGKLADSAVTTAKIANGNVTEAKIATGAVTVDKIGAAAVTAAKLDGAQSGTAPIYAARAWVNFNGTGTVAIRASGNVSSITDNGTGDYTVNFATAMSDANYAICGTSSRSGYSAANNPGGFGLRTQPTTSSFRVATSNGSGTIEDSIEVDISIFR
jgi:hypothetical protein